jgi:hypothetical protein
MALDNWMLINGFVDDMHAQNRGELLSVVLLADVKSI